MALVAGAHIGPYHVIAPLGAGGMGEVYRAHDTELGRDVALKLLPAAFAADPDRLMRFEREARTLAALNHPHIAQVYGVEDAPGAEGATVRALVMELVEGEGLDEKIASGGGRRESGTGSRPGGLTREGVSRGLLLDEALQIARQIADALEAAHEQGIIHRDLKPANIKVRDDGTVKVLDFGLAKAFDASPTSQATSHMANSPTITSPALTQAGIILGTAAYMAPEQAKGKPATKRSDIWAFGCVLYEMLTGRRAFEGEDTSDTLANVLKTVPAWDALPNDTPRAIVRLLGRCLERDMRRRVGGASAIRLILNEPALMETPGADASIDGQTLHDHVRTAEARARRHIIWRGVVPLAALSLLLLATIAAWLATGTGDEPRPVAKFAIGLRENPVSTSPRVTVALSRDGSQVAYLATGGRLLLRSIADFDAHPLLTGLELGQGLNSPLFSPDGRSLAFYASEGAIRRIAVTGGASVKVCESEPPVGLSWDASGIFVGQGVRGVLKCTASGAGAERVLQVAEGEEAHGPQLLPDGKTLLLTIALTANGPGRWERAHIVLQPLPAGPRRTLIQGGSDARYLPTGHRSTHLAACSTRSRSTSTGWS